METESDATLIETHSEANLKIQITSMTGISSKRTGSQSIFNSGSQSGSGSIEASSAFKKALERSVKKPGINKDRKITLEQVQPKEVFKPTRVPETAQPKLLRI